MKFNIPSLGDEVTLSQEWTFNLWNESRNESLKDYLELKWNEFPEYSVWPVEIYSKKYYAFINSPEYPKWREDVYKPWLKRFQDWREAENFLTITLPIKTKLKIDRIYIRKGADEFSSVTFRMSSFGETKVKGIRFWAKLNDVNEMEFEK